MVNTVFYPPAVNNQRASVWWALGFDLPYKSQQACRMVRYTVVWPASEVKLPNFSNLMSTSLLKRQGLKKKNKLECERNWTRDSIRMLLQKPCCKTSTPYQYSVETVGELSHSRRASSKVTYQPVSKPYNKTE